MLNKLSNETDVLTIALHTGELHKKNKKNEVFHSRD